MTHISEKVYKPLTYLEKRKALNKNRPLFKSWSDLYLLAMCTDNIYSPHNARYGARFWRCNSKQGMDSVSSQGVSSLSINFYICQN